jgi:hypothetical protein
MFLKAAKYEVRTGRSYNTPAGINNNIPDEIAAILERLPLARTITVSAVQATAAVQALDSMGHIREISRSVMTPFPVTLLDFGSGVPHDPTQDVMQVRGALFYPAPDGQQELALLTADGQVLPACIASIQSQTEHTGSDGLPDSWDMIADDYGETVWSLAAPFAALALLESANVELVESVAPYPRGHVACGKPKFDVFIRQSARRSAPSGESPGINFSHRFEVRGNFAHHFETTLSGKPNALFEKWAAEKPEKLLMVGGRPCVRIWRPPYVKGPENMPLIPKIRHIT